MMRTIRDLEITGKRVLIRVDFNVPMDESGNITDDLRITSVLDTIEYAVSKKARVILCSHMGRPKGKRVERFSLAPVARHLGELLGKKIPIAPDCVGPEVEAMVATMKDGDVLLLENLRFHAEEQENDPAFAKQLARIADVYINNAFAVSHRAHASVVGVTRYVAEKAAGFLLEKELEYFHRSVDEPVRPLVAIVGGAKVSSKLGALTNMLDKVDAMLIGGAMANTFLKSQGHGVGASKVENDLMQEASKFLTTASQKGVKVYLPVDVVAADSFAADAVSKQVTIQDIPDGWMALDIGPATVICFQEVLRDARTIIWNGPMGAFENPTFSQGSFGIAQSVAAVDGTTIVGGGDTDNLIHGCKLQDKITFISTGGGSFLEFLEGKKLPGLQALGFYD